MRMLTLRRKEISPKDAVLTKAHPNISMADPSALGPVTPEEAQLLSKLDLTRLPRHVAVIMDGPKTETDFLMQLLREYLRQEMPLIQRNNIRMRFLGRSRELPAGVQQDMRAAVEKTSKNTGMVLCLALNYGGRAEIVDALNEIVAQRNGERRNAPVTEEEVSRHLYTAGLPDPDLLIRSSGEMRVSNFLLWQIAYAEILVTETLWPDFNRARLLEAFVEFQKRERRYGGIREGGPDSEIPARVAGQ